MKELTTEQKEVIQKTIYMWLEDYFYKIKSDNKRYSRSLITKQAKELMDLISDNIIFKGAIQKARTILGREIGEKPCRK